MPRSATLDTADALAGRALECRNGKGVGTVSKRLLHLSGSGAFEDD